MLRRLAGRPPAHHEVAIEMGEVLIGEIATQLRGYAIPVEATDTVLTLDGGYSAVVRAILVRVGSEGDASAWVEVAPHPDGVRLRFCERAGGRWSFAEPVLHRLVWDARRRHWVDRWDPEAGEHVRPHVEVIDAVARLAQANGVGVTA